MNSLRLRLLVWLLVPLALYIGVSGWLAWQSDNRTAGIMQDQNLLASARVIAGQLQWHNGALTVDVPPAALELFVELPHERPSDAQSDHVFYRVVTGEGVLLAGLGDLPTAGAAALDSPAFATGHYAGIPVRMVTIARPMYDPVYPSEVSVTVAQTMHGRERMQHALWQPSLRNLLVMLALTIVLAAVSLTIELRPILRLKRAVTALDPATPQPIKVRELHTELRPVVEAINQYVQRLNVHAQMRKRFVSAAAHQLRTPLAVMDTQIENAMRDASGDAAHLKALRATSRSMSDLTAKLLLLAQAESAHGPSPSQVRVDLLPLCAQVLEDLSAAAQFRNIDLGLEALCEEAPVVIHPGLAQAMLANLVENAIRYTPPGGQVTVSLQADAREVILAVLDDGPGIHAVARTRVFEPFYRHAREGVSGSGLGLAIVKEVVASAQGSITLGVGLDGRGVSMVVRLPAAPPMIKSPEPD